MFPGMPVTALVLLAVCIGGGHGIAIGDITACQTGTSDLVGNTKIFTVQICNLFGATCYVNHPETASGNCATEALSLADKTCALYPIKTYRNNNRASAADLRIGGHNDCSVSCSGTDCKFSGACVSVQCSLGNSQFAGSARKAASGAMTNTAAAGAFTTEQFTSLNHVSGSKTAVIYRIGNYVASYAQGGSSSGTNTYTFGELPTTDGNNYGPAACPSSNTLQTAATQTKETMRMCGSTGKWAYHGGVNLMLDKTMYVSASPNTGSATAYNMGQCVFLHGESNYRNGNAMDDPRQIMLKDGSASSSMLFLTSESITPSMSTGMPTQDYAGQWRFYQVVFYCDEYTRTDLTNCALANRQMFYVGDPHPGLSFGTTASSIGSGGSGGATTTVGTATVATPTNTTTTAASGSSSGAWRTMSGGASLIITSVFATLSFGKL